MHNVWTMHMWACYGMQGLHLGSAALEVSFTILWCAHASGWQVVDDCLSSIDVGIS
jgi:hypothetical protein